MSQRTGPDSTPPVASVAVFRLVILWPQPQLDSQGKIQVPDKKLTLQDLVKPVVVFLRKQDHKTKQVDVVQSAAVSPRGLGLAEENG